MLQGETTADFRTPETHTNHTHNLSSSSPIPGSLRSRLPNETSGPDQLRDRLAAVTHSCSAIDSGWPPWVARKFMRLLMSRKSWLRRSNSSVCAARCELTKQMLVLYSSNRTPTPPLLPCETRMPRALSHAVSSPMLHEFGEHRRSQVQLWGRCCVAPLEWM